MINKMSYIYSDILNRISEYVDNKFVYQFVNKSTYNNIKYSNEYFIEACADSELDIVKWLIKFNPDINLDEEDYEEAFILGWTNGHLHIIKWLSEKYPDIDIYRG